MYNFGSFDAFIVKPTIMPDFARNLLHYCFRNGINGVYKVCPHDRIQDFGKAGSG